MEDKLAMCRICLVKNVRMHVVTNKNLQEVYEKLTNIPFVTEDNRPMLACFMCYAKLEQCWQLQRKCLETEVLDQIEELEENPSTNQGQLKLSVGFSKTPLELISIADVDVSEAESAAIIEELPAVCETQEENVIKEAHESGGAPAAKKLKSKEPVDERRQSMIVINSENTCTNKRNVVCTTTSLHHRPRQSLRDEEMFIQLGYGSEPDSAGSEDEDLTSFMPLPRAQRSVWDTPFDPEDEPTAAASLEMDEDAEDTIQQVPLSATDQPWGLYEFDWKSFPNVPIPPESRRETFSDNNVGPTTPCVDPYEIFTSIWDRQFMEYIASETNRYAQQVTAGMIETNNLHPNSRMAGWRDTTADELYVYLAIVIAMGVVVKSRLDEYWSVTPDIFYTPGFRAHMSGRRFVALSKCLHFVNNADMCALELSASEAKLFKVQPLISHLNNKFQSMYRLEQNIALDESLLQWKGWLEINQFIPNKAASVGIKTYEICESQTGYLWRFEVHSHGKAQRSPPQQLEDPMKASTPAIVLRLTQGLEGKGHTLWMDNFYNSPCLARRLKALGFDCVGTLRTNRKFVPQDLHSLTKGNMRQGQITGLTTGDVDVMVWKDKNRVAMISTYHGNGVTQCGESTKPILINDYNIMMGGVDKKDQMLAMFPIERKRTKVWYKKLFRRLLNVSVLNSYIIHYKSSFPSPSAESSSASSSSLSHRNFRASLINSILSKHSVSSSYFSYPYSYPPPPSLSQTTQNMHQYDARKHHLAEYPFGKNQNQRRRRKCVACGKPVQTYCAGCNKAVCITSCFLTLHP